MGKTYTEDEVLNLTESLTKGIQSAITVAVLKATLTGEGQRALMKEYGVSDLEGTVLTLNYREEILSSNINPDYISRPDVISDLTQAITKEVWCTVGSFLCNNELGSKYSARPLKFSVSGDEILPDNQLQAIIYEAISLASLAYANGDVTGSRHMQVQDFNLMMVWDDHLLTCTLRRNDKRCSAFVTAPDGGKWYE